MWDSREKPRGQASRTRSTYKASKLKTGSKGCCNRTVRRLWWTQGSVNMFRCVNGRACDTRKNTLMQPECLPREISVSGWCLCQLFAECSASSLTVPFCLQNQKRPGRLGGRTKAPIPWLNLGLLSMSPGDFRKAHPCCVGTLCVRVAATPAIKKWINLSRRRDSELKTTFMELCVLDPSGQSGPCNKKQIAGHTSDHPSPCGV